MAAPIIDTTTSIQSWKQWEYWEFQPYASNAPTSWAAPNLPDGVTIDSSTGKISGAATVAGLFTVGIVASNVDGDSVPLVLTINIVPASATLSSSGLEVSIDVGTRRVTFDGIVATGENSPSVFFGASDDDVLWFVRFKKGDVVLDVDINTINFFMKELEPDAQIAISTGFKKEGSGQGTYYKVFGKLDDDALKDALEGYEGDAGTMFEALCEIEWIEVNADSPPGPEMLRFTTQTFTGTIKRDFGEGEELPGEE